VVYDLWLVGFGHQASTFRPAALSLLVVWLRFKVSILSF